MSVSETNESDAIYICKELWTFCDIEMQEGKRASCLGFKIKVDSES